MRTPHYGDVPRGLWLAILLGFVCCLFFSLLLLPLSGPTGIALLALTVLVGWIEWRGWQRSREVTLPAPLRRTLGVEAKARRIPRYVGIAVVAFIALYLLPAAFLDEWGTASTPGDPSSAGVIDWDAFWSPDSRLIAFDRGDYGPPGDTPTGASDVFVASADGSELRPLTQTPESETVLGWLQSPLRVVYSVKKPKGPTTIYALDLEGGAPELLGRVRAADSLLALSHDARRALVAAPSSDPKHYALVDLARNTRHPLPGTANAYWWADGAWSPDESMLAYVSEEGIVVLRGDRVLRRIPDSALGGFAWSPDGRRLVYGSWGGYVSSLQLVRVEDGWRSRLAEGGDKGIENPFWSPDGSTIYYEHGSYDGGDGLRAIAPDGTGGRKITDDDFDGGQWLEQARLSPDGSKIVYVLGEVGDWKNWYLVGVMNADGSGKTPFPGSP